MNPKAVLLEDKELAKWWVSIVHDSRFNKVSTLAIAALATIRAEEVRGALTMLNILETFPNPEPKNTPFPSPGLVHEIPKLTTTTEEPVQTC